jgi:hypothetical protein
MVESNTVHPHTHAAQALDHRAQSHWSNTRKRLEMCQDFEDGNSSTDPNIDRERRGLLPRTFLDLPICSINRTHIGWRQSDPQPAIGVPNPNWVTVS